MQKYSKSLTQCLTVALLSVFSLVLASVSQAAPVLVDNSCLAPVAAQVNPLTKRISLDWSKVIEATSFNLQILPLGGICGETAPIREIRDIARTDYYTLPDDIACGLVTVCIQTNCCNDRCDFCQLDPNKDYCTDMADKYTGACGCKGVGGTPGTFKYKYAGSKVIGCSWECVQGFSGGTPKSCGTDYKIECGKPPHDTIVGAKPFYGLCNVFDSVRMRPDGDGYLVNPPGVGTSGSLLYTWNCLGAKTACVACRRAVCNSEFQGKTLVTKPNEATLCLENGVMTADPSKINLRLSADGSKWLWDCIGTEQCGADKANRNWVDGVMQEHCSAQATLCGWGHKEYVTYGTLNNNTNGVNIETYKAFGNGQGRDLGAFWCGNGARVEQPYRNNQPVPAPIHVKSGKLDTLKWRCVYDNPASSVNCQANLIDCNSDLNDKKISQSSFDFYTYPMNLCQAGDGSKPFTAGLVNVWSGTAKDNVFNWECVDKFFARAGYNSLAKHCTVKETACAVPPTGGYFKSIEELNNQAPLCINGAQLPAVKTDVNSSTIDGWSWACDDSFGRRTQCAAKRLTCATPPDKKSYASWTEFAVAPVSCENTADDNIKNCSGVCNKSGEKVVVTRDVQTNAWSWTCGEDKCGADYAQGLGCGTLNKSRHTVDYFEAINFGGKLLCQNGSKPHIVKTATGWYWICGADKCTATEVKCGEVGEIRHSFTSSKVYTPANWSKKNLTDLCVGADPINRKSGQKMTDVEDFERIMFSDWANLDSNEFPVGRIYGRWWVCSGTDGDINGVDDTLLCGSEIVDCGGADADKFLAAKIGNRIRPQTADGKYHASFAYGSGVPNNMRCTNSNTVVAGKETYDPNSNRGAFTWSCGGDSDGTTGDSVVQCSARKDCGWAGPEETGYATVYFSENTPRTNGQAAGCWTAEDVREPVSGKRAGSWFEFMGRTLNQYRKDGYDGFNHGDKNTNARIDNVGIEKGICPDGWETPSNMAWHRLEDSLDDGDKCEEKRLSMQSNSTISWQCNLAGADKSRLGYGLKSPITFSSSDDYYFSKTSPCSTDAAGGLNYNINTDSVDSCKSIDKPYRWADYVNLPVGTRMGGWFYFYVYNERYVDKAFDGKVKRHAGVGAGGSLRCVKSSTITTPNPCAEWEKFYQEMFGLKADLSKVQVPSASGGLDFLQCMFGGLSYGQIHDKEKEFYKSKGYGIMDWDNNWVTLIKFTLEERLTTKNYAIRHSGLAEAEATYAGKSANWIAQNKIKTMTRKEQMIFALYYYWKNNARIDVEQITYCTGSRYTNGGVPYVNWFGDNLSSNWIDPSAARDMWRPRPVLAL